MSPKVSFDRSSGHVVLTNGRLEVTIGTRPGVNARLLRDVGSGRILADRDYSWPGRDFPKMDGDPLITRRADGSSSVSFKGRLGLIEIEQTYTAPGSESGVVLEQITIRNPTDKPLPAADFKCGFVKRVQEGSAWSPDTADIRFSPVPYRRETDGHLRDFPLREAAEHGMAYEAWGEAPVQTPVWGAEAWVWSLGPVALLIAKYNPDSMEWSLLEPERRGTETLIRFGGAGQWKNGHPERSARLLPGESCRFGETRLQVTAGDWKHGFYAFRRYLEDKGCRIPLTYNPPIHWNELYDNDYYFKAGELFKRGWADVLAPDFNAKNERLLKETYSLALMLAEAAKAKELGCEALYLDPGWDTGPEEHIWDAARLGPMDSFLKTMRQDYGLQVSLWISLGGVPPTYPNPFCCPPAARLLDKDGKPTNLLCFASPSFQETKEKRLLDLCRRGIAFLMFDSDQYSGPCYDPSHGHRIPSTREEHAAAILGLVRRLKSHTPEVLIELHDPVTGPSGIHYTPTYFGYDPPRSFDCLWGHEFMWSPMDDLLAGRAVSLYYYNLAYSIPLYLHVNLKQDNENALVFWWYASTCRHLGVGGKPAAAVWEAVKKAMRTYKLLKRFYTHGTFYGIDETVHAHTLAEIRESVINIFNLEDKPVRKKVRFRPEEIGLLSGSVVTEGAVSERSGEDVVLDLDIPARGQVLLKVRGHNPGQRSPELP